VRRASWRLLPFLGLCCPLDHVDRVDVGFAPDRGASGSPAWRLQDVTGGFRPGMAVVARFVILAGVIVLMLAARWPGSGSRAG